MDAKQMLNKILRNGIVNVKWFFAMWEYLQRLPSWVKSF
jgi:hypothetical protein